MNIKNTFYNKNILERKKRQAEIHRRCILLLNTIRKSGQKI